MRLRRVGLMMAVVAGMSFGLFGCTKTMMSVMGFSSSKYQPHVLSVSDYEKEISLLKAEQNKVVSDEKGEYYFSFTGEQLLGRFIIQEGQNQQIRDLFKNQTGLLEPVYKLDKNFNLVPDWKQTGRLKNLLEKNGVFTLLPMSASKRYDKLLMRKITDQYSLDSDPSDDQSSFSEAMAESTKAFDGERSAYNSELYGKVLRKFEGEASFLVSSRFTLVDLSNGLIQTKQAFQSMKKIREKERRNGADPQKMKMLENWHQQIGVSLLDTMMDTVERYSKDASSRFRINLASFIVFQNMTTAGFEKKYTGSASVEEIEERREYMRFMEEQRSASAAFASSVKQSYTPKAFETDVRERQREIVPMIRSANQKSEKLMGDLVDFMAEARKAFQLTGAQKTQTLE